MAVTLCPNAMGNRNCCRMVFIVVVVVVVVLIAPWTRTPSPLRSLYVLVLLRFIHSQ